MTRSRSGIKRPATRPSIHEQAGAGIIVLVLVFFILGIGLGMLYYKNRTVHPTSVSDTEAHIALFDTTRSELNQVKSPVEIRFYSLLDTANVSEQMKTFSARVDHLISEYEREAGGKIKVTRINALSDANANAASSDGLRPFNLDKGAACYLGLAVANGNQKEVMAQLSPEWENALQYDLARTIERVALPAANAAPAPAVANPAVTADVKRIIPDYAAVSIEQGTLLLNQAAYTDFAVAAKEMEAQRSEKGTVQELQKMQLEQADKLKEIAARLQAQVAEFKRLKGEEKTASAK